ncbi:hypothetical protein V2S66_00935 [Streptomyces sp. V4-01]|uniref:Uncharacterized protein n=1 Tax=Actinacidiphila polyblastidii TaxID=3110430 RepID=A0ABU7P400_9ACTN|nr:hypothetical protein [Streptomyces sp. V4-01]
MHAASYFLMAALAAAHPRLFAAARAHGATASPDTNDDPPGEGDPAGAASACRSPTSRCPMPARTPTAGPP